MDCGSNACRNPVISPDGEQVAFERRAVEEGESGAAAPAPSRVELLSIADPSPAVVSPPNHPAAHPVWAPAGWLSYFDAADRVITVEDLQGGRTHVPNATGELWIWTPDSRSLIFPEITVVEPDGHNEERPLQIYSNLYLVDMADNSRRNLSGNFLFEDSSPALSPDGRRLLFTRNFFDTRWTPGVQLWMMDLEDDSTAAVTDLPDYGHSSPRWNPDGTLFLFMRFHATSPTDPPEIWLADSAGADPVRLATGGYLPRWIP
jgi:Tol biopolymer transport system component